MRRAVITGIGPLTPTGIGNNAFWQGLQAGRSAVGRITQFDPSSFRSQMAAEVQNFAPTDFITAKRLKRMDRYSQFAVTASHLAIDDAGLVPEKEDSERVGVSIGTALGGVGYAETQVGVFNARGLRAVDPMLALSVFGGAGSCNIAIEFGFSGPNSANANSCASGTMALGQAMEWIRHDHADVVLAGGAEAPLVPLCYSAFTLLRAMSSRNDDPGHASRPFDASRDGFVMGEGAAVMVVEELHHALARNARIYGEIVGFGLTNDANHMTAPLPTGAQAARAMKLALQGARISPAEIDYINAHGSSTQLNDKTETLAIKHLFNSHAHSIPISSIKGHHGHALGASGAIEAAACLLMLEQQYLIPTVNLEAPDPECDLDYIPRVGRQHPLRTILSNSFGFGGINASIVLRKWDPDAAVD
ncbi:MAG TPA: beta-ketoacyl-ACP synthase II [Armatimonadota bacterium]|nr:beta-ketoacyl-ACP synthase II [Armatimonadota bacterium]